jgi:hypothetical protein
MREINYSDVIKLGFTRQDQNDNVFFNQYGFGYFIVSLKINNQLCLNWDCNDRTVKLVRVDKEQIIKGAIEVQDLKHLVELLTFLAKLTRKNI